MNTYHVGVSCSDDCIVEKLSLPSAVDYLNVI